jgi:hypothetical protein
LKSHKTPPFATEDTCLQAMLGKPQLQKKNSFWKTTKSNVSVEKKGRNRFWKKNA